MASTNIHPFEAFEQGPDFEATQKYPPIPTFIKLEALNGDELAEFLPTTHEEKSQAFEILSYWGDPMQYRAGVGNRLQEIFQRQRRLHGPNAAKEALISITHEYGDHLRSATKQLAGLESLASIVDECDNPGLMLTDETLAGSKHPGLIPLVRYKDLKEFRKKGYVTGVGYDPLHTIENRKDPGENKNKNIEDPYTATEPDPEVAQHILDAIDTFTVGSVRELVKEAVVDQKNRQDFWLRVVRDTRKHGAAWIAGKQILTELGYELR